MAGSTWKSRELDISLEALLNPLEFYVDTESLTCILYHLAVTPLGSITEAVLTLMRLYIARCTYMNEKEETSETNFKTGL